MSKTSKRAQPLTRERIAEAALALIDKNGIAGFSARSLAKALRCEAMSLYHYFEGMDGILDAVVDALFREIPPAFESIGARRQLAALSEEYLALAERHPHSFVLIATRRWRTPAALAQVEATLRLLGSTGLRPRAALRKARVLGAYLNGAGLALAAWQLSGDTVQTVEGLAPDDALNADAVKADLIAGVKTLVNAIL